MELDSGEAHAPVLLHVGCGRQNRLDTTAGFARGNWREIRIDIDPGHAPDVLADISDLRALADGTGDALFSSHNIEHLEAHQVMRALGEWRRVLKPDGIAVIACPDLQAVAEYVARDSLTHPILKTRAGAISALDILFGHRPALAAGNGYMAHRCGFTESLLASCLRRAGFGTVVTARRAVSLELWALAGVGVMEREAVVAAWRNYCVPVDKLHIADTAVDAVPFIEG